MIVNLRKVRKFACLFVMALLVFAVSGCGGSSHDGDIFSYTESDDVTPTPTPVTSPDVTPTPTPTTSPDVTPTPATSPDVTPVKSPDVIPTPPTSPDVKSPDVTPSPAPTQDSSDKAAVPETTSLNLTDSTTTQNITSALGNVSAEVQALPADSTGAERTIDDVSPSDLAAIPSDEKVELVLPVMSVQKAAVYVFGVDLSTLNEGDYIYMHMMPESNTTAAFAAAEDDLPATTAPAEDPCAFLDESGNRITRVPANKKANAAAYMTPEMTYAPLITSSTTAKEEPAQPGEPVPTPVPEVSPDVEPVAPDVSPDVEPVSPDVPAPLPESGDTPVPDGGPESGDMPGPRPESGDMPMPGPDSGDQPVPGGDSGDVTPTPSDDDSTPTEDETITGQTYTSSTALENALLIDGATSTYTNITVTKTGDATGKSDDSTSGYDWYGTNAAVLAKNGANATISGTSTITTNAVGGNAVFAYGGNSGMNTNNSGDGTKITISDAAITTQSNNSGGIMVTGGGIIEANSLTITTAGGSSAAIRSDRGGGTITATGGTYTTSGTGSPAIYSTAAISVYNADLTSNTAQVVVIEGGNSVELDNVTLTAHHTTLNGQDTQHQAVLIYQSQSGDASNGASSFTMKGGSLTNSQGDIFHVTNTTTTITLSESASITNSDTSGVFLRATSDSWGGSNNGGNVTLNADGQTINGDMVVDNVSTLTFNMSNSSIFNGAINTANTAKSTAVVIDASSTWNLMGNSYVTSLTNNGTINTGTYTLYVNGTAYQQ